MKNKHVLITTSTVILFLTWWILSMVIHNEILLPSPIDVALYMAHQVVSMKFWQAVCLTLLRMLKGLVIAALLGIGLGCLTGKIEKFRHVFYPLEMALKTIPNISYIIISLIWLGSEKSVTMVSFLVLFPIFFANTQQAILAINPEYHEVTALYQSPFIQEVVKVDLPLIAPAIKAAFQTAMGLGFKVCVMAEILGRVQKGIGFQIDFARQNLDMTGVFAWTLWIIILSVLFDGILKKSIKKTVNSK